MKYERRKVHNFERYIDELWSSGGQNTEIEKENLEQLQKKN